MYSTSYSSASSAGSGTFFFIMLIVAFLYLAAWVVTMLIVTDIAREKGYYDMSGKLWFIGLFGFIVTPCVLVAALPDKKLRENSSAPKSSELPPV